MARYQIRIFRDRMGRWNWQRLMAGKRGAPWGPYKTAGTAKSAAKRSVVRAIGKSDPKDFQFIEE